MEYFKYEKEGITGKVDIKASADTILEGMAVILLQIAASTGGRLSVEMMTETIEKKYIPKAMADMAFTEQIMKGGKD